MSYTRRNTTDGSTIMNKDLYDNLQDGIEQSLNIRRFNFDFYGGVPNDPSVDNTVALQNLIDTIEDIGGEIFFQSQIYYFKSSIILRKVKNISFVGIGMDYTKGTQFKYTGSDSSFFKIHGCSYVSFKDINFLGGLFGKCFSLEDLDEIPNGDDSRSFNLYFDRVHIRGFLNGISIDTPTGYIYIDNIHFSNMPNNAEGIVIGKNFDFSKGYSVKPNYIYITHCNIDDLSNSENSQHGFSAISLYCCQWVWIESCDLCNFADGTAIYINGKSQSNTVDNINIVNNALFNNKIGIDCTGSSLIVKSEGNKFSAYNPTDIIYERYIGIEVHLSGISCCNNVYNPHTKVKYYYYFQKINGLSFSGNNSIHDTKPFLRGYFNQVTPCNVYDLFGRLMTTQTLQKTGGKIVFNDGVRWCSIKTTQVIILFPLAGGKPTTITYSVDINDDGYVELNYTNTGSEEKILILINPVLI